MLPYILAVVVGLSSLYLLTTAFIAPDRHRQDDFLWSAVGLFYALVLWLCAGRITGAILLGQAAAAILFIAFAWQTLKLRQALFYPDKPVKLFTIVGWLGNRLGKVTPSQSPKTKAKPEKVAAKVKEKVKETVDPVVETAAAIGEPITESVTEIAEKAQETVAPVAEKAAAIGETITESVTEIGEKAAEIIDDGETFDDFDDFDSIGGNEFATRIEKLVSGHEARISEWTTNRGSWEIGQRSLLKSELDYLISLFRVCRGKAVSFKYFNWQNEGEVLVRFGEDAIAFRFDAFEKATGRVIFNLSGVPLVSL